MTVPAGNIKVPDNVKLVTFAKSGNGVRARLIGVELSVVPVLSFHSIL